MVLSIGLAASDAQAERAPLSAAELAQCADQVQTLRARSAQLNEKNAEFEKRRADIKTRTNALKNSEASANTGTQASSSHNQKNIRLKATIAQFNDDIEQFRNKVVALNQVKENYDAGCSGRSYRRSDFSNLKPASRAAMKAGLGDVQVPYTQALKPLPGQKAQ